MRYILFLIAFAAALLLAFYFFRENKQNLAKLERAKMQLSEAENKLMQQRRLNDSLHQQTDTLSIEVIPEPAAARQRAISQLRKTGLADPENQLLTALQQQPSMIPRTGTMGGEMRYRSLALLTSQLALAYFEDGHNGGYSVLRFKITSPAEIRWKLLDHHDL